MGIKYSFVYVYFFFVQKNIKLVFVFAFVCAYLTRLLSPYPLSCIIKSFHPLFLLLWLFTLFNINFHIIMFRLYSNNIAIFSFISYPLTRVLFDCDFYFVICLACLVCLFPLAPPTLSWETQREI